MFANSPFTTIDTAIIRSSRPVVFLQISQNSQENSYTKGSFLMKLQIYRITTLSKKRFYRVTVIALSKKILQHRCFLVNSAKFLRTLFLKNPSDGCFCLNTRFGYCPTTTFCFLKNDVTHIFRLSIFSA